ncbi:hypothetical protein MHBO_003840, partial [Bonamia ostreae]
KFTYNMIKLVLDPYEAYSPFDLNNWRRIRKTRWSGDDGFSQQEQGNKKSNWRNRLSTSIIKIENRIITSKDNQRKKRWGSQARTKLTIDDINLFQLRLEKVTVMNRKLLFPNAVPEKNDPLI